MQGWRLRMEDAHLAIPDFDPARRLGLFGVFDGHGGAAVAKVVAERFPGILREQAGFKKGRFKEALRDAFMNMDAYLDSPAGRKVVVQLANKNPASDEELEEDSEEEDADMPLLEGGEEEEQEEDEESELDDDIKQLVADNETQDTYQLWVSGEGPDCMGTTAVVALVRFGEGAEVYVANAGDSRCIMSTSDAVAAKPGAVDLSEDHKPVLPGERARIKKAGGFITEVQMGGRVDGNLSLSRAFGDFAYKKNKKLKSTEQRIIAEPEVTHRKLEPSDKLLILGCDGIWEKATSLAVAQFVSSKLGVEANKKASLSGACAAFLDHNLARTPAADKGLGCDNMSLMAVDLHGVVAGASVQRSSAIVGESLASSKSSGVRTAGRSSTSPLDVQKRISKPRRELVSHRGLRGPTRHRRHVLAKIALRAQISLALARR